MVQVSPCHKAKLEIAGGQTRWTTRYYICTKCKQACDPIIVRRSDLIRSPKYLRNVK